MKKLVILATVATCASMTPALAFGPSPSDPHPPGALFQSTPSGAEKNDPLGGMVNPPVDMRTRSSVDSLRSSNVRLDTQSRKHRGVARSHRGGREDSNTAPLR